ncbi:hypothetical protein CRE_29052 [Caenorhabditis remanei]|uniref:NR LBD domain-containing protein n=1 Tax=Caenorhabditis remanei TaxID=31234 RepID=E3MW97_CAERE|nr:hypothetical protein CRE_29052 [Caenorhabditis remanei]
MFFRRIVLGNKNYKCTLPKKEFCEKNILKCKGCRFEKCKRLGMYLDIADIGGTEESRTKQMEGENKDLLELLENLKKLDTLKTAINPDEFSSQFPTMLYFLNCNIIQILGPEDKTQILKYNRQKLGYFIGVMVLLNKSEPDLMMYSNDGWNKDLELVGHMASMKISHEEYLLLILVFFCNPAIPEISQSAIQVLSFYQRGYCNMLLRHCQQTHGRNGISRFSELLLVYERVTRHSRNWF